MERAYDFQFPEENLVEVSLDAVYNPALTIRGQMFEQYPQLRELFAPISRKLDTKTLLDLNYAVEVEGKFPDEVARRWLRQNGFVE